MNFLNFYILGTVIMAVLIMINNKSLLKTISHIYESQTVIQMALTEKQFIQLVYTISILFSWINIVIYIYQKINKKQD